MGVWWGLIRHYRKTKRIANISVFLIERSTWYFFQNKYRHDKHTEQGIKRRSEGQDGALAGRTFIDVKAAVNGFESPILKKSVQKNQGFSNCKKNKKKRRGKTNWSLTVQEGPRTPKREVYLLFDCEKSQPVIYWPRWKVRRNFAKKLKLCLRRLLNPDILPIV